MRITLAGLTLALAACTSPAVITTGNPPTTGVATTVEVQAPATAQPTTTTTVAPTTTTLSADAVAYIQGQLDNDMRVWVEAVEWQQLLDTPPAWSRCPRWWPYALKAGFTSEDWSVLDRIIFTESTCNPRSHNGTPPDDSYCGVQVNYYGSLRTSRTRQFGPPEGLYDMQACMNAAAVLSNYGSNWSPWAYI